MELTHGYADIFEEFQQLIEQSSRSVLSSTFVWFGGVWLVMLFIRKVTKDADDDLDSGKRKDIAEDLAQIKARGAGAWIPDFTDMFDHFFGKKHLSWHCFFRSFLISTSISVAGIYWFTRNFDRSFSLGGAVALGVIINGIAGYLSLLETRIILRTSMSIFSKIVFDLILTFLITFGWIVIFLSFSPILVNAIRSSGGSPPASNHINFFQALWEEIPIFWGKFLIGGSEGLKTRVIIGTGYTTSIWVWLYGIAQATIKMFSFTSSLTNHLNIKERPVRAIGVVVNVYVLLIGVVLFPIFLIVK